MLYLGAAGVLTLADLPSQPSKVIHAVAEGRFWFRRDVLQAYVKQTSIALRMRLAYDQKFTAREQQIIDLLLQNFSNRLIAEKFAVSERTIKFHVSNILRKFKVGSRNELRELHFSSAILTLCNSLASEKGLRETPQ